MNLRGIHYEKKIKHANVLEMAWIVLMGCFLAGSVAVQVPYVEHFCDIKSDGIYSHPQSCRKFIKCNGGRSYEQECGGNLHFNPTINVCDHPQNSICADAGYGDDWLTPMHIFHAQQRKQGRKGAAAKQRLLQDHFKRAGSRGRGGSYGRGPADAHASSYQSWGIRAEDDAYDWTDPQEGEHPDYDNIIPAGGTERVFNPVIHDYFAELFRRLPKVSEDLKDIPEEADTFSSLPKKDFTQNQNFLNEEMTSGDISDATTQNSIQTDAQTGIYSSDAADEGEQLTTEIPVAKEYRTTIRTIPSSALDQLLAGPGHSKEIEYTDEVRKLFESLLAAGIPQQPTIQPSTKRPHPNIEQQDYDTIPVPHFEALVDQKDSYESHLSESEDHEMRKKVTDDDDVTDEIPPDFLKRIRYHMMKSLGYDEFEEDADIYSDDHHDGDDNDIDNNLDSSDEETEIKAFAHAEAQIVEEPEMDEYEISSEERPVDDDTGIDYKPSDAIYLPPQALIANPPAYHLPPQPLVSRPEVPSKNNPSDVFIKPTVESTSAVTQHLWWQSDSVNRPVSQRRGIHETIYGITNEGGLKAMVAKEDRVAHPPYPNLQHRPLPYYPSPPKKKTPDAPNMAEELKSGESQSKVSKSDSQKEDQSNSGQYKQPEARQAALPSSQPSPGVSSQTNVEKDASRKLASDEPNLHALPEEQMPFPFVHGHMELQDPQPNSDMSQIEDGGPKPYNPLELITQFKTKMLPHFSDERADVPVEFIADLKSDLMKNGFGDNPIADRSNSGADEHSAPALLNVKPTRQARNTYPREIETSNHRIFPSAPIQRHSNVYTDGYRSQDEYEPKREYTRSPVPHQVGIPPVPSKFHSQSWENLIPSLTPSKYSEFPLSSKSDEFSKFKFDKIDMSDIFPNEIEKDSRDVGPDDGREYRPGRFPKRSKFPYSEGLHGRDEFPRKKSRGFDAPYASERPSRYDTDDRYGQEKYYPSPEQEIDRSDPYNRYAHRDKYNRLNPPQYHPQEPREQTEPQGRPYYGESHTTGAPAVYGYYETPEDSQPYNSIGRSAPRPGYREDREDYDRPVQHDRYESDREDKHPPPVRKKAYDEYEYDDYEEDDRDDDYQRQPQYESKDRHYEDEKDYPAEKDYDRGRDYSQEPEYNYEQDRREQRRHAEADDYPEYYDDEDGREDERKNYKRTKYQPKEPRGREGHGGREDGKPEGEHKEKGRKPPRYENFPFNFLPRHLMGPIAGGMIGGSDEGWKGMGPPQFDPGQSLPDSQTTEVKPNINAMKGLDFFVTERKGSSPSKRDVVEVQRGPENHMKNTQSPTSTDDLPNQNKEFHIEVPPELFPPDPGESIDTSSEMSGTGPGNVDQQDFRLLGKDAHIESSPVVEKILEQSSNTTIIERRKRHTAPPPVIFQTIGTITDEVGGFSKVTELPTLNDGFNPYHRGPPSPPRKFHSWKQAFRSIQNQDGQGRPPDLLGHTPHPHMNYDLFGTGKKASSSSIDAPYVDVHTPPFGSLSHAPVDPLSPIVDNTLHVPRDSLEHVHGPVDKDPFFAGSENEIKLPGSSNFFEHETPHGLFDSGEGDLGQYALRMMRKAKDDILRRIQDESSMARRMRYVVDSIPFRSVAAFFGPKPYAMYISHSGAIMCEFMKLMLSKYDMRAADLVQQLSEVSNLRLLPLLEQPGVPDKPMPIPPTLDCCPYPQDYLCETDAIYRTYDGSCNNLKMALMGRSMAPFKRLLPAAYADDIDAMRVSVVGGHPLPGARKVSLNMFPDRNLPSNIHTNMLMIWSQFVDHDLTRTAITEMSKDGRGFGETEEVKCGYEGCDSGPGAPAACWPIEVPHDDPDFGFSSRCLKFVRSQGTPPIKCNFGPREQINQVTSWLDGSMIYGSTKEEAYDLRDFSDSGRGRMLVSLHPHGRYYKPLLPKDDVSLCREINITIKCFKAGDERVNEQVGLTALHTIWVREHNRIEQRLYELNPHWGGERLYQETRKIVGAMIQHIVYNEQLPMIVGQDAWMRYNLKLEKDGYLYDYDDRVDPRVGNAFSAAAYRFGHTLVQEHFRRSSYEYEKDDSMFLSSAFRRPVHIYDTALGGVDSLIRGMCDDSCQRYDTFFTKQISRSLFTENPPHGPGMDLLSLNIQRGRDHGLPGYNKYREHCGLRRAYSFDDLSTEIKNPAAIEAFRRTYRHVDDIDLFAGGIAEASVVGGIVGPTFACVIARQFSDLRKGDRFWYEGDSENGFTIDQLLELRKAKLSRILCANGDYIDFIQPWVLLKATDQRPYKSADEYGTHTIHNPRGSCDALSDIDLTKWQQGPYIGGTH